MDIKEIYKEQLKKKEREIDEISSNILQLQQKLEVLNKEISALNILIGNDRQEERALFGASNLSGLTGIDSYKKLIKTYFLNKPFRESEIRELSEKKGLRIKGKPIGKNTSWGILKKFDKIGYIKRINKGLYQYKNLKKQYEH